MYTYLVLQSGDQITDQCSIIEEYDFSAWAFIKDVINQGEGGLPQDDLT